MRDYKKHLTLLPHKWQVVGIPLVCVLIAASIILLHSKDIYSDEKLLKLYETLSILTGVLLMICCLSKEKVEDEYITSVRYRALTISVVILFIASAVLGMINGNLRVLDFLTVRVSDTNTIRSEAFSSTAFVCSYRVIGFFASISCMQIVYIILLKVLARIGNGNNYRSILLPNKCKKVGWWILPCSLVLIAIIILNTIKGLDYSANDIGSTIKSYETALRLTVLLPYLAIILICLSKEKQEDEFISQIRARIIAYFAIYYLIASFISEHTRNAYEMSVMASGHVSEHYNEYAIALVIFSILSWLPIGAVVYSLVLKKVLSNNIKESSNEE
jgi:hypothetical protein